MEYIFYDTDITGNEDYDISGENYKNLLKACFRYCTTVSFYIWNVDSIYPSDWEKFRLPTTQKHIETYTHYYYNDHSSIHVYQLNEEMKESIMNITDSMFKWICGMGNTNPDDPIFYREDGSVFFWSCIHDGECRLLPRSNEDVSNIICSKLWHLHKNN